ncbi:glycoside hydrolase family 3 N-terminal domain-containing protein [Clostridium thermarum]|uniref:glycoside hydrolase family 3 N-terminal domain-containing protein n=1 Tax=Clostridium thermarum TaxID=1716543 RepID=UPI0013CF7042|nr:glycoside hydrolase family 3 N-terminal domain-containing protein [Clostridium thermarum]
MFSYGVTGFIRDAQVKMSSSSRLGIPIAFMGDKVHGWKTIYPTGLGLASMMRAIICGMQGGPEVNPKSILITVKHWPSQGAGGEQTITYDSTTIKYHMKPWYAAMDANCGSIMPGYGGAPFLDPAGEGAGTSKPTIDYLRNVLGFKQMLFGSQFIMITLRPNLISRELRIGQVPELMWCLTTPPQPKQQ